MSQPSTPELEVRVAMDTDPGLKRKQNQDAIGHSIPTNPDQLDRLGRIFVLADGVGGLTGGDLASQYAVSTIISSYYAQASGDPPERLARAIAEANNVIFAEWQDHDPPQTMATTVVAVVIRGEELVIGSVGDSPAYLMRNTQARQLTQDHTLKNQRIHEGAPLAEDDPAGRKLVRALGSQPSVRVDIITGKVRSGDYVVLCSDGLTRYLTPEEIEHRVATLPLDAAVHDLIAAANDRGGADNISVIVLYLHDENLTTTVGAIENPMDAWGVPRRVERSAALDDTAQLPHTPRSVRRRVRLPDSIAGPARDLWRLLRGNVIVTAVGMALALVLFVIVMFVVSQSGDSNKASRTPSLTPLSNADLTATVAIVHTATAQERLIQTNTALQDSQAMTAAAEAVRSLTPATPIPTHGPQMAEATWFKVQGDRSIPAYQDPDVTAAQATALEVGSTYRVTMVNRAPAQGPWYQVIDNQGQEARWVNGPSLHARIVAVDTAGNPLPDDQQPPDIAPPDEGRTTPTATPTPQPTLTGTPGTLGPTLTPSPVTPTATPSPTATIAYGPDVFPPGSTVAAQVDLLLCSLPSVGSCENGADVLAGETGTVLAGPVASGEHWWWQVDFGAERSGWVAQVLLMAQ